MHLAGGEDEGMVKGDSSGEGLEGSDGATDGSSGRQECQRSEGMGESGIHITSSDDEVHHNIFWSAFLFI